MRRTLTRTLAGIAVLAIVQPAAAELLAFGPDLARAGWVTVTFPRIPPASFKASDATTLEIVADRAAGLLWRRLGHDARGAQRAQWSWRMDEGVPPTDLTKRGADDRAIGVYFVFGEAADADKGPMTLLKSSSVTVLVYVLGGDKPRGTVLPSPHMGARGRFVVLRPASAPKGTWLDETVDLNADYQRAFAGKPPLLLAIAISSDSDDTRGRNRAQLRRLTIGD